MVHRFVSGVPLRTGARVCKHAYAGTPPRAPHAQRVETRTGAYARSLSNVARSDLSASTVLGVRVVRGIAPRALMLGDCAYLSVPIVRITFLFELL